MAVYLNAKDPPLATGEAKAIRDAWTLGSARLRDAIKAARGELIGVVKCDRLIWNTTPGYATEVKHPPEYPYAAASLAAKQEAAERAAQSPVRDACWRCGARGDVPCGCQ